MCRRSVQWILFYVFTHLNCSLSTHASSSLSSSDQPVLQLSIYPSHGISAENIEIRCLIRPSISNPSAPANFENVYLSVKSDNVKPSGILLMVDNYANECRINREKRFEILICNRTEILIRLNHTILNRTRQTVEYGCNKGDILVRASYRLTVDQRTHIYSSNIEDSMSSAATVFSSSVLILFSSMNSLRSIR